MYFYLLLINLVPCSSVKCHFLQRLLCEFQQSQCGDIKKLSWAFLFCFEKESHYVALGGLELTMKNRLVLKLPEICLPLPLGSAYQLRQGLSLNPESSPIGSSGSSSGSTCVCLTGARVEEMCDHTQLLCYSWKSQVGFLRWVPGTLPAEPSHLSLPFEGFEKGSQAAHPGSNLLCSQG